jgi:alpha-D-ribose 1-methylphosphonate 5-triphosphate diphosphatase
MTMTSPVTFRRNNDSLSIVNCRAVLPGGILEPARIRIEGGLITDIGRSSSSSGPHRTEDCIDARGCLVLPGFVDIHADSLEAAIAPRPSAPFLPETVLPTYEASLVMHGITTVFHCVGLADLGDVTKPLRTRDKAREIVGAIRNHQSGSPLRVRIHLRYEITDTDSLPLLDSLVEDGEVDMMSLMDHTPGFGVFKDIDAYREYHRRSGQSLAAADEKVAALMERRDQLDEGALAELVDACHRRGLTVVSHDDHTVEKLEWALSLGVSVAEFPVTVEALDFARGQGMQAVYGTPNLIRGVSHAGNLRVADMLTTGRVDIFCLDYSPMCSLLALFTAVELTGSPLAEVSRLFSLNPARAVGLDTVTGSIEIGKAADLILVDQRGSRPRLLATIANGRPVYRAEVVAAKTEQGKSGHSPVTSVEKSGHDNARGKGKL